MRNQHFFLALFIAATCFCSEASLLAQTANVHPAFTMRLRTTSRNPDGSAALADEVRYFSAYGHMHLMRKSGNGKIDEWFHLTGQGRFVVNRKDRTLVHEAPEGRRCEVPTAQSLRTSPQFLRQETMLGMTVYVHRFVDPQDGLPLRDVYHAPEVGCVALKMVHYKDGIMERVTEAVSVDFGEPDAGLFALPNYALVGAR